MEQPMWLWLNIALLLLNGLFLLLSIRTGKTEGPPLSADGMADELRSIRQVLETFIPTVDTLARTVNDDIAQRRQGEDQGRQAKLIASENEHRLAVALVPDVTAQKNMVQAPTTVSVRGDSPDPPRPDPSFSPPRAALRHTQTANDPLFDKSKEAIVDKFRRLLEQPSTRDYQQWADASKACAAVVMESGDIDFDSLPSDLAFVPVNDGTALLLPGAEIVTNVTTYSEALMLRPKIAAAFDLEGDSGRLELLEPAIGHQDASAWRLQSRGALALRR